MATGSKARLEYLDSMRGIAAVLVVFHHLYQTHPFFGTLVRVTPARLLLNGRSSVIFFFVLSGFALAYGLWQRDQPTDYIVFVKRRFARIYLPYFIVGIVAIILMIAIKPKLLSDTAITFNEMWATPITFSIAAGHLALFGSASTNSVNTVSWSLVYEIRISLLIPFLCLLASRSVWLFAIASLTIFSFNELMMYHFGMTLVPDSASGLTANILVTVHFAGCFVVGILLARAAHLQSDWLFEMPKAQKWALVILAVPLLFIFRDEFDTAGSAALIVLALNTEVVQRFLSRPTLLWLGKISFSLYLTHAIVIQVVVRILHGKVPLYGSLLLASALILPVAFAAFYFVEEPTLRISRSIGKKATVPVRGVAG
jgi:peptidoglycan/LPS O-acetylase OafA/YrhL